jgi:hypothetical protein
MRGLAFVSQKRGGLGKVSFSLSVKIDPKKSQLGKNLKRGGGNKKAQSAAGRLGAK